MNIKKLSVILAMAILIPNTKVGAQTMSEGLEPTDEAVMKSHVVKNYPLGDLDGDYTVGLQDVQTILRYYLKMRSTDTYGRFLADVDGDGKTTLRDAKKALRQVLKMDEQNVANSISDAEGNTTYICREAEDYRQPDACILTDPEDMYLYLHQNYEDTDTLIEKYRESFEKYHVLAAEVTLSTDDIENAEIYTVVNQEHILIHVPTPSVSPEEKMYRVLMLVCVDRSLTDETAVIDIDAKQSAHLADIVTFSGNGESTAEIDEATKYIHLIRNVDELEEYKHFLASTFSDVNDLSREEYIRQMDRAYFQRSACVVFTYFCETGVFAEQIKALNIKDNELNVTLRYIDQNTPGVPSARYCIVSVFVNMKADELADVTDVNLNVIR